MTFRSLAVSIKMSALLYLPGLLVILYKRKGLITTARLVLTMVSIQALMALEFINHDPWAYFHSAFDLSRIFLYKWTVNWRFVDEHTFLSPGWARGLLLGHAVTLIAFGLSRWCSNDGGAVATITRGFRKPRRPAGLVPLNADGGSWYILPPLIENHHSAVDVTTILFTSNLVGILFARSLHYQFYSWYAQQIPFLIWKSGYPLIVKWVQQVMGFSWADMLQVLCFGGC